MQKGENMKPVTESVLSELIERYPVLQGLRDAVEQSVGLICGSYSAGGKTLACGNGGSAADSEHIVGELMKSFVLPRPLPTEHVRLLEGIGRGDLSASLQQGVPAISLTSHISLSTATLNDVDPYMVFAQQVYVLGRPGDTLIGISTSGNAKNVLNAASVARAFGLNVIGLTGARESKLDPWCDVVIKAPETQTFKVQELHLPIYHAICAMVESELFLGES